MLSKETRPKPQAHKEKQTASKRPFYHIEYALSQGHSIHFYLW